jgi:hypothetical protein
LSIKGGVLLATTHSDKPRQAINVKASLSGAEQPVIWELKYG